MFTGQLYNVGKITYSPVITGLADPQIKADDAILFGYVVQVMVNDMLDPTIFEETTLPYNYGSFAGTCFEKSEETRYNVDIRVYDRSDNLVKSSVTSNGEFKFINLNQDVFYNIEFQDNINKYLGKKIFSIKPETDQVQPCAILLMDYKKDIIVGSTYKAIFKTYGLGSKGVTSANKPAWLTIEQLDSEFYTISGTIPAATTNVVYTITLSDSRTGGTYTNDLVINHKVN